MHKRLTLATASIHSNAHDTAHNSRLIKKIIEEANQKHVDMLLLPELCLSGYGSEDLFFSRTFIQDNISALLALVENLPKNMVVIVGLPIVIHDEKPFNGVAVLRHGEILGIVCKQHLAHSGIHYEPRWFQAWPKGKQDSIVLQGNNIPVGDLLFDIGGVKIGFEICEDSWVEMRPGIEHAKKNVDIILNPSASHFNIAKQDKRRRMVLGASKQFECVYLYSNLVGCEAGRAIYDGANMIANKGAFLSIGQSFSFEETNLELVTVDLTPKPLVKNSDTKDVVHVDFSFNTKNKVCTSALTPAPVCDNTNACVAIALGLWHWQIKTKTSGFVVSLSGGADSALCASLVYLAHWCAFHALGEKQYITLLASCDVRTEIHKHMTDKDLLNSIMPQVLTTVYQRSKNSSEVTRDAANTLASALGASYEEWSIDEMVNDYVSRAEKKYKKTLTWKDNDIALQNIQARVRSPGAWLLANIENKLLIATSNMSEAVVGYCTMDGDTSGVLSPIGGVSKTRILELNAFLMNKGIQINNATFQINALKKIVNQQPTAELRPDKQSDEADLMPYEVLDTIRELAQINFLSPEEIALRLKDKTFKQDYKAIQLQQWCERYFELYYRNQWKRERLAPSFHIEYDSACPKTYRRFPIL